MRARDFVQKRKELYEECEDFIEQLLEDKGKPWYTFVKRDAERISEKIAHVRDIKDLERYEQDLKHLKIYKRGRRSEWSSLAVLTVKP